jgi:hypothetical protein
VWIVDMAEEILFYELKVDITTSIFTVVFLGEENRQGD